MRVLNNLLKVINEHANRVTSTLVGVGNLSIIWNIKVFINQDLI